MRGTRRISATIGTTIATTVGAVCPDCFCGLGLAEADDAASEGVAAAALGNVGVGEAGAAGGALPVATAILEFVDVFIVVLLKTSLASISGSGGSLP